MSCIRRASVTVPAGTPLHARGGDWLAPWHVNWAGMAAPLVNDGLVNRMAAPWAPGVADPPPAAEVTVFEGTVWGPDCRGRPCLPPELQAPDTASTKKATTSLRSTRFVYPKEGTWPTPSNP